MFANGLARPQSVAMTDAGLIYSDGTILVRMSETTEGCRHLHLEKDCERLVTLLSVVKGRLVAKADVLPPIEAAAQYWRCGDHALENLRLVFADLPQVDNQPAAHRLHVAAELLDGSYEPVALMKALWPKTEAFHLRKYAPDQPRVPAGSGRVSGEWAAQPSASRSTANESADRPIVTAMGDKPPVNDKQFEEHQAIGIETTEEQLSHQHAINPAFLFPCGIGPGGFAGRSVPAGPGAKPSPNSS